MPQYDFNGEFANADLLGKDGYLPHLKSLPVSQCSDRIHRVASRGRHTYHVQWRGFAGALRNKRRSKCCRRGWYSFFGLALQHQVCRRPLHSVEMCEHNTRSCPLGMVAAHLTLLLSSPAGYALDSRILEPSPPSHQCEQFGVGLGYALWNPTGFSLLHILYSSWPIFALLSELRPILPRLWNETLQHRSLNRLVQKHTEGLSALAREVFRLQGNTYKACLAVCNLLDYNFVNRMHRCPVLVAEQTLEEVETMLEARGRKPWSYSFKEEFEKLIVLANEELIKALEWLQPSGHTFFAPAARIVAICLISANIIFPRLARIQVLVDRDLYIPRTTQKEGASAFVSHSICPASAWPEQGSLSVEASFVRDFHFQFMRAFPPGESRRKNIASLQSNRFAWVVFLWGGEAPHMQESVRITVEAIRTLSFSVRRAEAPLRRPFIVLTVGTIVDDVVRDLRLDNLQVRSILSNESLLGWKQEAVHINEPLDLPGDWFSDRKLPRSFAQLAAWTLRQFSRIVVLDADMLMLERCDELFDLGAVPFAASYETHYRQTEPGATDPALGGEKNTVLLNAAVMSLRPDPSIFARIQDALLWPAFRLAVERLAAGTSPTFQSLIDIFFLDTSRRRGLASWDMETGIFQGCRESAAPLGEDASGKLLPPWQLDHGDHCVLPMEYNFFADFPHIIQLAMSSQSAGSVGRDGVERRDILNGTLLWLRETGHLRRQPKLIHFPGVMRKPWQRWATISRSPWDEAWWTAHREMCSLSQVPCRITCDVPEP